MFEIASVFGLVFSTLFSMNPHPERLVVPQYECKTPAWIQGPAVKNNHFEGTVEVRCRLKGEHGGGFPHLREAMEQYLVDGAETIHEGPVATEYKGMAGVYYDVTANFSSEEAKNVRIRGGNYLASNLETQLKYDFFSKKIEAEGMAKYMRVVNILSDVQSTDEEGWYAAVVSGEMKVEKPKLVPSSYFVSQVKKEVESQIEAKKEEVVTQIANNL